MDTKLTVLLSRKDDSFQPSRTGEYHLILQPDETVVTCSVREAQGDRIILLESLKNSLPEVLDHLPWLRQPFRSVRIFYPNNKFTLLPELLYDEDNKENLLDFTVDRENREQILTDRLLHPEMYNLYAVPEQQIQQMNEAFPQGRICHVSSALIECIWINYKNQVTGKKIFIHIRGKSVDLLVFDGSLLHYCNAFSFVTPEDLVYYLIFVMEQLDLNPEETGAVLMGEIERRSPVYELIYRYVRNVEFAVRNESVKLSPVFHDVPGHSHYLLLNPLLCGS